MRLSENRAELARIKTQSGSKARSRRPCTLQIKGFSWQTSQKGIKERHSMDKTRDVALIVESLRKGSLNRKVANALAELAPPSKRPVAFQSISMWRGWSNRPFSDMKGMKGMKGM